MTKIAILIGARNTGTLMSRKTQKNKLSFRVDINSVHTYIDTNIHIYVVMMIAPATFFKCLSDETRLRCINLLYREGELCVCELTHALALSQPKISRHLGQLRQYGLLQDNREGQWVYYKINPQLSLWGVEILSQVERASTELAQFQEDRLRLQAMEKRPGIRCCE